MRNNENIHYSLLQLVFNSPRVAFYLLVSIIMIAIVLMGFLPSVYYTVIGVSQANLLLHTHAILYLAWMFFFTLQAILPAFGRLDLHKKLGKYGFVFAVVLFINGLHVTYVRFCLRVDRGDFTNASHFLLQPLSDMIAFALLITGAFAFRKNAAVHKRLMLLATLVLTIAAIIRIHYITIPGLKFLIWISPIALAMAYDFYKSKLVHPIYVIGLFFFAILYARMYLFYPTDAWQNFANFMIEYTSKE